MYAIIATGGKQYTVSEQRGGYQRPCTGTLRQLILVGFQADNQKG